MDHMRDMDVVSSLVESDKYRAQLMEVRPCASDAWDTVVIMIFILVEVFNKYGYL
jgi:hypothetical protein